MQIIIHRVNKIEHLKRIPKEYGVEIDIRGYGEKLLLNHDPLNSSEEYDELDEYLKSFSHAFSIFNLKEAGYEKRVIDLAKKHNIEDYFLLDVEFPYLYRATRKEKFRKIAVRYSEAEPIEATLAQKGFLDWVWIDTNTRLPLTNEIYEMIKSAGFKTCLVCPEMWGRPQDITPYINFMKDNHITIDAVMTSENSAEIWKELEKSEKQCATTP